MTVIPAIFMAVQTELGSLLQSRSVTVIAILQIEKPEQGMTMTLQGQNLSRENQKANSEPGFSLFSISHSTKSRPLSKCKVLVALPNTLLVRPRECVS